MDKHTQFSILIWIFCVSKSFQQPQGYRTKFQHESIKTIEFVSNRLQIQRCLNAARDKVKQVGACPGDQYEAIVWMSMYSRLCTIDKRLLTEDKHINNFPFRLNKELRCSFTVYRRDPRVRTIFLQAGVMIDKAIDVLNPYPYQSNLYRGLEDFPYADQNEFVENGFFSATTDINVALHFANGNILLIVERMYGVYIADYAQERFRHQREVLAKRHSMFRIRQKVTNSKHISEIIAKLKLRITRRYPKEIIYIYQIIPGSHVIEMISDAQSRRQQSYDYCRPS
ncbi:uncharacterized protein LOC123556560 [Mercenaria mercenaria]|uniref:uncharacterized protein LOC123556560 n=1 Tax=Mercenaria mercenaria TaxID=6596 RepID=UPI00234E4848|nr:uncharacterized protein LOC123556560 [Mercenaria mercenaria]